MKTRRVQLCWMPPSIGSLKFNVDGAVKGDGQVDVKVYDSNLAELLAIKTTLEVFVKIDWKGIDIKAVIGDISFVHTFREANSIVDAMEKANIKKNLSLFSLVLLVSRDCESKSVTNAQSSSYGGKLIKWGSFDPLTLARFVEHVEKPIYLKPWWLSEALMEN
ncbi:hypothetical protein Gotri_007911 [Gossypium trilobum]|uniref:RNase H type-1 domain-containing protein n=1 Tax=Gossypium trilobum TaxID=34281 RepID=A0A7J9EIF7_9ROSI|nr:hypothetical protein [Gossypium trilobum]